MRRASRGGHPRSTKLAISCQSTCAAAYAIGSGIPRRLSYVIRQSRTTQSSGVVGPDGLVPRNRLSAFHHSSLPAKLAVALFLNIARPRAACHRGSPPSAPAANSVTAMVASCNARPGRARILVVGMEVECDPGSFCTRRGSACEFHRRALGLKKVRMGRCLPSAFGQ